VLADALRRVDVLIPRRDHIEIKQATVLDIANRVRMCGLRVAVMANRP